MTDNIEYGRYGLKTEREAAKIREYNKRQVSEQALHRQACRWAIEDIELAKELGIDRGDL